MPGEGFVGAIVVGDLHGVGGLGVLAFGQVGEPVVVPLIDAVLVARVVAARCVQGYGPQVDGLDRVQCRRPLQMVWVVEVIRPV